MIQVSNLKFQNFLQYPDLTIPLGKVTFLSGESGCGKSTLLKLLNATLTPSSGRIEYCGRSISEMDTISLRREVLLASQEVYLFDGTIQENFKQYYRFRDQICISETKMRDYLSICCADFPLDTKCQVMSGGERQRVFLSICLSFLPKALMLDEPTAALDDVTSIRFFSQLKSFCMENQITLVVICHNKRLIEMYADGEIVLQKKASE
ncbi:MAG: transporter related protein [Evtepia sp.]|nr:transporter related protein [Evtepia sp.]